MIRGELAALAARLAAQRTPFVLATVVRAGRPTSVRPGDSAVVHPDGRIDGFVGGMCAESSVTLYSLRALETGEPILLRLVPAAGESDTDDAREDAIVERNPCLSGGALEIFLEPCLPAARVLIAGSTPVAHALRKLCAAAGYDVADEHAVPGDADAAVIVASHGRDEERVLSAALEAGVPYVALVASAKRGAAVRDALDVAAELSAQLHTPAGLDIGARTPSEVAISILAELVKEHHAPPRHAPLRHAPPRHAPPRHAPARPASALDPICGMEVALTPQAIHLDVAGERVFFCGSGCRDAYARLHAAS